MLEKRNAPPEKREEDRRFGVTFEGRKLTHPVKGFGKKNTRD